MAPQSELVRAQKAYVWVGVVIPSVIMAGMIVVIATLVPRLPDPVAVHWSGSGADGFAPLWTVFVIMPAVVLGLIALFAFGVFWAARPRDRQVWDTGAPILWGPTARFVGGVSLGMSAMLAFVQIASLVVQLDLADAMDAPDIGFSVLAGFGILVAFSAIGFWVQPRVRFTQLEDEEELVIDESAPDEWTGRASIATSGRVTLGIGFGVSGALFFALMLSPSARLVSVIMLAVLAVIAVFCVLTMTMRVRADATGLTVRFLAPWPPFRCPAAEIEKVRVYEANPFAEFGGWGIRKGLDGRTGYVLRKGPAIEVTRSSGRKVVITIDDAEGAAVVLRAAAQRARNQAPKA